MFNIGVNSAKLEVGMTLASINGSDVSQKIKDKQIELFNKYNTTPDNEIDEKEFEAYERDKKKSFCTKFAIWAGIAVIAGVAGYLAYRGIKNPKSVQKLSSAITKSTETVGEKVQATAKNLNPDNFINKMITTNVPGQKVLITNDLGNPPEFIATFFNDGVPCAPTKLPLEKLPYFISNLK